MTSITTTALLSVLLLTSTAGAASQPSQSNAAIAGASVTQFAATTVDTTLSNADRQASTPADAETPASALDAGSPWRFEMTAWIWIIGMDGTVGARGQRSDVDASFGDIMDASDSLFAFSGRMEVGYEKWGGFIDGMYSKLGVDDQSGPLGLADIDLDFETVLIDFGAMYRIGEWEPTGDAAKNAHKMTLDLYGGARYTNLELTVDPALLAVRSQSVSWFDPIFGARFVLPFAERWHVALNGDIGGFGAGSDFTWSTTAVVGYDFSLGALDATAYAGYRVIGQDYTEGDGANQFTWDVVQHGFLLGLAMRF